MYVVWIQPSHLSLSYSTNNTIVPLVPPAGPQRPNLPTSNCFVKLKIYTVMCTLWEHCKEPKPCGNTAPSCPSNTSTESWKIFRANFLVFRTTTGILQWGNTIWVILYAFFVRNSKSIIVVGTKAKLYCLNDSSIKSSNKHKEFPGKPKSKVKFQSSEGLT